MDIISKERDNNNDQLIKCNLYGKSIENSIKFSIDENLMNHIRNNCKRNTIFNVLIGDKKYTTIIREIQKSKDIIKNKIIHIDFLNINKESKTIVNVKINILNQNTATVGKVSKITLLNFQLPLMCYGTSIISSIDFDLNDLTENSIIFSNQLILPKNVFLSTKKPIPIIKSVKKMVKVEKKDLKKK